MAELGEDGLEQMADDFEEFADDLKEIRDSLEPRISRGVATTAERLGAAMEDRIIDQDAVDTGELLNSITVNERGEFRYAVGPTADHAKHVEYGTGDHDITPQGISDEQVEDMSYEELEASGVRPLMFTIDGQLVRTYKVDHPGTPAQPFFNPAVKQARNDDWLVDNINDELDEEFGEVLG